MVSKEKLMCMELKTIEQYFEQILETLELNINVARRMYNTLSSKQKKDFELYCLSTLTEQEVFICKGKLTTT